MPDAFRYNVFLSRNRADQSRVRRQSRPRSTINPRPSTSPAIERGLEASRTLVLCLSPAALGSDWVGLERSTVLFRDPANAGRRFIPLLLADCKLPETFGGKYVD